MINSVAEAVNAGNDSAVWRRFTYRIELSFPKPDLRTVLWKQFLHPMEFTTREIELLVDLSEGFSGSDIREVCLRLHRQRITTKTILSLTTLFALFITFRLEREKLDGSCIAKTERTG